MKDDFDVVNTQRNGKREEERERRRNGFEYKGFFIMFLFLFDLRVYNLVRQGLYISRKIKVQQLTRKIKNGYFYKLWVILCTPFNQIFS